MYGSNYANIPTFDDSANTQDIHPSGDIPVPSNYANIPTFEQSANTQDIHPSGDIPVPSNYANIPKFSAPAAPQPLEPNDKQFVVEKANAHNASAQNERVVANLPQRAIFRGQVVTMKGNGGLLLKSEGYANAGSELIHLPQSAAVQLEKNSRSLIQRSMHGGRDGVPVEITHFNGTWSASDTSRNALHRPR